MRNWSNQHLTLFTICNKTGSRLPLSIDVVHLRPSHFQKHIFLSTSAVTYTTVRAFPIVDCPLSYLLPTLCIVFTSTYMQFVISKCHTTSLSCGVWFSSKSHWKIDSEKILFMVVACNCITSTAFLTRGIWKCVHVFNYTWILQK